jgi:hypothetical protein
VTVRDWRFALAAAPLGMLIVGLTLRVATREWFSEDDFIFLEQVMSRDPWSWSDIYWPLRERFWVFYRPLSMETYFWVGYRLFGLDAFGFFAVSLAFHFATGLLVWRLALAFGFAQPVAVASALFSVSRPASLTEIFYGSVFMYASVLFFGLLCVLGFLHHLRRGGAGGQLVSCLALLLAFCCNEVAVTLPAVLLLAALGATRKNPSWPWVRRIAVAVLPQAVLTGAYLVFRFLLIAPGGGPFWEHFVRPNLYTHRLGAHVLPNISNLLRAASGSDAVLVLALLSCVAIGVALAREPAERRPTAWLLRMHVVALGWLVVQLPAFALLPQLQLRWAMMLVVPIALLLGAWWNALWGVWPERRRGLLEAGLLIFLIAAVPYAALQERAADPKGGPAQRLARWVAAQRPQLPRRANLVVLHGAPDLAREDEARRLDLQTREGLMLAVIAPGTQRTLRFHDVSRRAARSVLRPDSVYIELLPGIRFARAGPARLDRELHRGVRESR